VPPIVLCLDQASTQRLLLGRLPARYAAAALAALDQARAPTW
jgi:hypothetical protein